MENRSYMECAMHNIKYQALKNDYILSESQKRKIAGLIYETDPYIYPAMFLERTYAETAIPKLIDSNDPMFCKNNLYCAFCDDRIIALILWKRGPLEWDVSAFRTCLETLDIPISPYLKLTEKAYFEHYRNVSEETISILNVVVDPAFQNCGIGGELLQHFLHTYENSTEVFELFVLADNLNAIRVYKKNGFRITEKLNGFSIDNRDLPCFEMQRKEELL